MTQSSYPKVNFNDLLAEWIDSFATYKECDYSRREDGTYDWVDWNVITQEERMAPMIG